MRVSFMEASEGEGMRAGQLMHTFHNLQPTLAECNINHLKKKGVADNVPSGCPVRLILFRGSRLSPGLHHPRPASTQPAQCTGAPNLLSSRTFAWAACRAAAGESPSVHRRV
jgi:hypothetical protein